jgi:PIN domain nuclease of toxin-antitoxin system
VAEAVLDASALVAFLRNEPGTDKVAAVLTRSCISAVNLAEAMSKMVEHGKRLDDVCYQIERLGIEVISFTAGQAKMMASMWKAPRVAGASEGDRACMALALETALPVLTTTGDWEECGLDVKIVRIR